MSHWDDFIEQQVASIRDTVGEGRSMHSAAASTVRWSPSSATEHWAIV
jgi:hypothetical protein